MAMYEVENVEIPVKPKPKGKWDDFVEAIKGLQPFTNESIFVPIGEEKTVSLLKEHTSKALNKAGLKTVSHQEEHPLRGGVGLRFWNKTPKTRGGRGKKRGPKTEEWKKKQSEKMKEKWAKLRELKETK